MPMHTVDPRRRILQEEEQDHRCNDVQEGTEDRALGRLRRYYAYLRSVLSARDTAGLRMAAEAAIQFL